MPYAVIVHPSSEVQAVESPLTLDTLQAMTNIDVVASVELEHGLEALFDDESAVNDSFLPNLTATFGVVNLGFDAEDVPGGWLCGSVAFAALPDEHGHRPELTDEQWSVLRALIGF